MLRDVDSRPDWIRSAGWARRLRSHSVFGPQAEQTTVRARPQARAADEEAVSDSPRVDPIVCEGHGICAELFPERMRLDDWGYPIIDGQDIPRALVGHARRAVAACPVLALRLVTAKKRRQPVEL